MSRFGLTNTLLLTLAAVGQANCVPGTPAHGCPAAHDEVVMLQRVAGRVAGTGSLTSDAASSALAAPVCGGKSAYPTLLGAQYNWTAYQLEWMPGNVPGYGFFHSILYQPDFPQQMDITGKPNASGRFSLLRFTSVFAGTAYIPCVFDTQASLTCIAPDGGFFGRFVVTGSPSQACVPNSLLESAGYLSPATGWVVMVRAGVLGLVNSTEVQVAAQSVEQLHDQAPAAVPAEVESTATGCIGFPVLAGANYSLTSYRFNRSGDANLGAANFSVDKSWTFSFFDNLTQYNSLNWHHQYVQLTINNGEQWALCVFDNTTRSASSTNSSFSLLCSVHPEGRFVVELSVSPLALNAQTCVPSRLSLKVASGSLLVNNTAANGTSTRKVLVWTGALQLTAYNGSTTFATQSELDDAEGTLLDTDAPQPSDDTSVAEGSWYPSLVNQTYTWLSSELTCLSNQSGNTSVVVQRQVTAKFFNQMDTDGKASPIGSFVQLLLSGDTLYSYYAICAFQDRWALRCVSSADGLLVHDFQVESDSVNDVTRVPSRLTELRHGSLALPGDAVVRQGLLAIGEPSLNA